MTRLKDPRPIVSKTLASAATIEKLEALIKEYFYGSSYKCEEGGRIVSTDSGRVLECFKWEQKRKRFYFIQPQVPQEG